VTRLLALIGLVLSLAACTASGATAPNSPAQPSSAQSTSTAPSSRPPTAPSAQASPSPHGVDKILVIIAENRNAASVVAQMPFLDSQSQAYGRATNYYAISHPSLPNYLVMAGGSTFGVEDDEDPVVHPQQGRSVFGQMLAAGRTAKTYAEAMPGNCALRNDGNYAVRHNPWTYFVDRAERSACERFDVPSGSTTDGALKNDITSGQLPNLGFLIPDDCNNGHSCSIDTTDRWLRKWLPVVEDGTDFRSGRLAVLITWDEDEDSTDNRVAMVVLHPALKGRKVTTKLDHYVLSATISRLAGAKPLRDADGAPDLLAAFGVPR
jgi:hypothetical protein